MSRHDRRSIMFTILSTPALQDLKFTFKESVLVFPCQETKKRSLFLSNIDQIVNFNIATVHFFDGNPVFPPEIVAKRLKTAFEKLLVPYDFMAGRFKRNEESGRLEIDCNAAGAGFVVASSGYRLVDLGDLVAPNLGFRQLAVHRLENLEPKVDQPLCILQITSFKCGGFAIGLMTNHALFDGMAAKIFLENLASQSFDNKPLSFVPCHDRHLLAARSPLQTPFLNPEFLKPTTGQELECKVFKLSSKAINYLKEKASCGLISSDNYNNIGMKISRLTVALALIWRCKVLSATDSIDKDRVSTLQNTVNIRSRMSPPLPTSYCGNAVISALASAKCSEIEDVSCFPKLVERIAVAPERVTDEYVRSFVDLLEMNNRLPLVEYLVTSWLRLGMAEVEYPWGKPIHSGPVVSQMKETCIIFPDSHLSTDTGINALVLLPAEEMARFEYYFRYFFE